DGRDGLTPIDGEIARMLRESEKTLFPIVNKVDGPSQEPAIGEFYSLGYERIFGTSAEHGYLVDELMDEVMPLLPTLAEIRPAQEEVPDAPLKLAVVGKPNAGKSTLVNKLLGAERMLT